MKVYIFRHAEKARALDSDPDLTDYGHQQAQHLAQAVAKGLLDSPTLLVASPKRRAQSTLRPLAQELGLDLKSDARLYERENGESLEAFKKRIRDFLHEVEQQKINCLFLCSHYDWVVEAMGIIPSETDLGAPAFMHWSPCQYASFKVEDGLYHLLAHNRIV